MLKKYKNGGGILVKGFTHEDYLKIEQNPKAKKF